MSTLTRSQEAAMDNTTEQATITSPETTVKAIPILLGFLPEQSIVALWLDSRRLIVTTRSDLDTPSGLADVHTMVSARHSIDSVILAVYGPDLTPVNPDDLTTHLPDSVTVIDVIAVTSDRYKSLLCQDPQCCPSDGLPLPAPGIDGIDTSEAPLAGRDELGLPFTPRGTRPRQDAPAERDEAARAIVTYLTEGTGDPHACASNLFDVRVRDTVLYDLTAGTVDIDAVLRRGQHMCQAITPGDSAPALTLCAALAYGHGNGALATTLCQMALGNDPGYSLAHLIEAAATTGVPPQIWTGMLTDLGRDTCLNGAGR